MMCMRDGWRQRLDRRTAEVRRGAGGARSHTEALRLDDEGKWTRVSRRPRPQYKLQNLHTHTLCDVPCRFRVSSLSSGGYSLSCAVRKLFSYGLSFSTLLHRTARTRDLCASDRQWPLRLVECRVRDVVPRTRVRLVSPLNSLTIAHSALCSVAREARQSVTFSRCHWEVPRERKKDTIDSTRSSLAVAGNYWRVAQCNCGCER
jgi:hypothetical protein